MFGRGSDALLDALPRLDALGDAEVRRLLSQAWLEVVERRELGGAQAELAATASDLQRLALALQVHAVVAPSTTTTTAQACAFVAAEALDIARELGASASDGAGVPVRERLIVALLYLIAGYDANANVSVRDVDTDAAQTPGERYAFECAIALVTGAAPRTAPELTLGPEALLHDRVREALWCRVGELLASFTLWLRDPARADASEAAQLLELADALRASPDDLPITSHADVQHFARIAGIALGATAARAARSVPAPVSGESSATFERFMTARCARQPLLWPAAAEYAATALPGPSASAVVAVPTGSGKSGVADLAIQHAIADGWVLYIAPTNALVMQIRRQLRRDHPGVVVREFLGGAEYTTLSGEALESIHTGHVLVMTPEKCSLALRQSPEAFRDLALVVFDEAHLLGDGRGRGVLSELVLTEALTRADNATVLLMSALIANPEAMAGWLAHAHGRPAVVINEPWRPTRTLRAVVGIDGAAASAAAEEPAAQLSAMPTRRRHLGFEAPLAALAGLRGSWTTQDAADYALVGIGATTPMQVSRPVGGGDVFINRDSANVRPTVEALAQLLGSRGEKVMAFLPRSRHDSFLAAVSMSGFDMGELEGEVSELLELASAELGVDSLLRATLEKGVAVHTSALLAEERRASELAFEGDGAPVMFATGTLAQGLNLPATTVLIGGTDIGYDPDQSAAEKQRLRRSQLLNAIGRAGRARVAARALALVVPNDLPILAANTAAEVVLPRADFLAEEDASTEVRSALRPLLARVIRDDLDPADLWTADHIALAYLTPADDGREVPPILRRSWAAYELSAQDEAETLAATIGRIGLAIIEENGGPPWAADAAQRAAVPLPVAARFARYVTDELPGDGYPRDVSGWMDRMIAAIETLPSDELSLLLRPDAFRSTALAQLWSDDDIERAAAVTATRATLASWLSGESLAVVGGFAHGGPRIESSGRGQRDPIPRTIRLVDTGIGFGLTRAAGLLAATLDVAVEQEALEAIDETARNALERLPVALRFGAGDAPTLALVRAGARPRAVAHVLAAHLSPPRDVDDEELHAWAQGELGRLPDRLDEVAFSDRERRLVASFLLSRDAR